MKTIQRGEYTFSVDIEKTKEYYKNHSLCDCENCRKYYANIKEKFPTLDAFLSVFGVDISRPDEISAVDMDDCVDYLCVYYSVCGQIKTAKEYQIEITDGLTLNIIINRDYAPNEQSGDYFMISVAGVKLPFSDTSL